MPKVDPYQVERAEFSPRVEQEQEREQGCEQPGSWEHFKLALIHMYL